MPDKLRVAILLGGRSAEHEVSLNSARNVLQALDIDKFDPLLIAVDKKGVFWLLQEEDFSRCFENKPPQVIPDTGQRLLFSPGAENGPFLIQGGKSTGKVDCVFPVLHGTFGEDGTVQGLLELLDIPYVGAGVLGSAVGMDKDVMKRLLQQAGIPTPRFLVFNKNHQINFNSVKDFLGLPVFVKPANLGSSVGISKVQKKGSFNRALDEAFRYDRKIIIEEFIRGREVECSVLGNENPLASLPGEIIPTHEFYTYDAKYVDEQGAKLVVPAELPSDQVKRVQELAVSTFEVLCCEGMARVDFFIHEKGEVLVNEINTIPGFTNISMYPKLWEATGISQKELVERLIHLGIKRFESTSKLRRHYL